MNIKNYQNYKEDLSKIAQEMSSAEMQSKIDDLLKSAKSMAADGPSWLTDWLPDAVGPFMSQLKEGAAEALSWVWDKIRGGAKVGLMELVLLLASATGDKKEIINRLQGDVNRELQMAIDRLWEYASVDGYPSRLAEDLTLSNTTPGLDNYIEQLLSDPPSAPTPFELVGVSVRRSAADIIDQRIGDKLDALILIANMLPKGSREKRLFEIARDTLKDYIQAVVYIANKTRKKRADLEAQLKRAQELEQEAMRQQDFRQMMKDPNYRRAYFTPEGYREEDALPIPYNRRYISTTKKPGWIKGTLFIQGSGYEDRAYWVSKELLRNYGEFR